MADLITKLLPVLHVDDPGEERRFYEQLGLRTTYEGPEYPDFIAVRAPSGMEVLLEEQAG